MYQPIVTPTVVTAQNTLGQLQYQGCSGDGTALACLFSSDAVPAGSQVSGLLKVLDPVTLAPLWGDAGVEGSYVLGAGVYVGEVPYLFPNGQIGAGDSRGYALYNTDGTLDMVIALNSSRGSTMGLTPLSANYAIISQVNGTLTLIDTINWVALATLTLKDPNGASVTLVSPSTGSDGVRPLPTSSTIRVPSTTKPRSAPSPNKASGSLIQSRMRGRFLFLFPLPAFAVWGRWHRR